ncbi:MAG: hypothetical protein PF505_00280 [Vallitaleaceae bacterium]|nr:hypothetical protein [Vallitaleaceae bacterium]
MIERNSSRDISKLENWDSFIEGVDFSIPKPIDDPNVVDDLLLFYNSTEDEYETSMKNTSDILGRGGEKR